MIKEYWLKLWIRKLQKEVKTYRLMATLKESFIKDLQDELKYKRFD